MLPTRAAFPRHAMGRQPSTRSQKRDVILTDGPGPNQTAPAPFHLTTELLDTASAGVHLELCTPFIRGREVAEDAVVHPAFVGHAFNPTCCPCSKP